MSVTCRFVIFGMIATSGGYLSEAARSDGNGRANYQFQYRVKDELTGQDFGQEESRTDYHTAGEYEVMLPDGRRQIVTYTVLDATSGYVANVEYEGVPHYDPVPPRPKYTPVRPAPAPLRPASAPLRPSPVPTRAPAPSRAPATSTYRQQDLEHVRQRQAKATAFRRPEVGPRFQASGSNRHQSTLQRPIRVKVGSLSSFRGESGRKKMLRKSKKIVVSTPSTVAATPAVYIPSRYPKTAQYKELLQPRESKILYSLFREDINEIMTPPKKIPAKSNHGHRESRRRRY